MNATVNVVVNGQPRQVAAGMTVAELLGTLNLATRYVAVEINLEVVPRQTHAQRQLADGDRLEIVALVGGG